jgi:predicted TIM-barrel fold metal-dependent hydrolase
MSAAEFVRAMDANGVEGAVVTTAETCPDLQELSRAASEFGDRLRSVGLPMGKTAEERLACVTAQMECGFAGIRLPAKLVAAQPELLRPIGEAQGSPFVVGGEALRPAASALLEFLQRYPKCVVCAPHFAGPTSPVIFSQDEAVARLFRHPRFLVIFSRHGGMDAERLSAWTKAVLALTGWDRLMYGSEYPVALWRDESYRSTQNWIDSSGLVPTAAQKAGFLGENAHRHFFMTRRPARIIDARWSRLGSKTDAPVWLFTKNGIDLPEAAHRKILLSYLKKGGDARLDSYRNFVTQLCIDMAERL